MASGGAGRKQQDGGGSGSWLLTGLKIGAALGAAALGTYAAVQMAQQEEKQKEAPMRRRCSGGSFENEAERQDYPSLSRGEPKPPGRASKPKRKPSGSLTDELREYYDTHIDVPSVKTKRQAIQNLVEETRQRLSSYLTKNHRRLVKGELTPAAFDKFVLKQQEEFRLMLPLAFDPKMWEFNDAADTVLNMPGYFCVRRVNVDFYNIGRSPWDRFLVGSYLCPELLHEFLKKIINQMITEGREFDFYCNVKRNAGGVEMNIENPVRGYGSSGMLCIKIIPYMTTQKRRRADHNHCPVCHPFSDQGSSVWREQQTHTKIYGFSHLKKKRYVKWRPWIRMGVAAGSVWQSLNALGSSIQPLGMFSRYQMITVLLKACMEENRVGTKRCSQRDSWIF